MSKEASETMNAKSTEAAQGLQLKQFKCSDSKTEPDSHDKSDIIDQHTIFMYKHTNIQDGIGPQGSAYLNPAITNVHKLVHKTIAHREGIDFYIPSALQWNQIVPLELIINVHGKPWTAKEAYRYNLINNSTYFRQKMAIAILDGEVTLTIDFDQKVLTHLWYLAVLSKQISWAQALSTYSDDMLIDFLMFAHCFGFGQGYILHIMGVSANHTYKHVSAAVYVTRVLLDWQVLSALLAKQGLHIGKTPYLDSLSQLPPRLYIKKLRGAFRKYNHVMDKLIKMDTILYSAPIPDFMQTSLEDLDLQMAYLTNEDEYDKQQMSRAQKQIRNQQLPMSREKRLDFESWLRFYDIKPRNTNFRYITDNDTLPTIESKPDRDKEIISKQVDTLRPGSDISQSANRQGYCEYYVGEQSPHNTVYSQDRPQLHSLGAQPYDKQYVATSYQHPRNAPGRLVDESLPGRPTMFPWRPTNTQSPAVRLRAQGLRFPPPPTAHCWGVPKPKTLRK